MSRYRYRYSRHDGDVEHRTTFESDSREEAVAWMFSTWAEDFELPLLLETNDDAGVVTLTVGMPPSAWSTPELVARWGQMWESGFLRDVLHCLGEWAGDEREEWREVAGGMWLASWRCWETSSRRETV